MCADPRTARSVPAEAPGGGWPTAAGRGAPPSRSPAPTPACAAVSSSSVASTVSVRMASVVASFARPQSLWQKLSVGPSKSQCDAPSNFFARTSRGNDRANVRALPARLHAEASPNRTIAGTSSSTPRDARCPCGPPGRGRSSPRCPAASAAANTVASPPADVPIRTSDEGWTGEQVERAGLELAREIDDGRAVAPQVDHVRQVRDHRDDARFGERDPEVAVVLAGPRPPVGDDRQADDVGRAGLVHVDRRRLPSITIVAVRRCGDGWAAAVAVQKTRARSSVGRSGRVIGERVTVAKGTAARTGRVRPPAAAPGSADGRASPVRAASAGPPDPGCRL